MSQKEKTTGIQETTKKAALQSKAFSASRNLNNIIKTNGYQKGRLFYSRNKATYTFVEGNDVISLHFDLDKKNLYFKGHKITGWEITPHLSDYLEKFKQELLSESVTKGFIAEFDNAVMKLDKI